VNKEEFQARITAAQAGKNTTFSELEKKKTLREQLESDLELFLTCGGEVNELPQGFSGELQKGGTTENQNPKRPCMKLWQALYQKLIRSVLDKGGSGNACRD
jgi:hypothetical protein